MIFNTSDQYSYGSTDSPIVIRLLSGRVLYSHPNQGKRFITFNLIKNRTVKTKNRLTKLSKKTPYIPSFSQLFRQYPPEHNKPLPKRLKIIKGRNSRKASVNLDKGVILVDRGLFSKLPVPTIYFILFHELGHFYYDSESKTDLFASVCMLKMGFNVYDCLQCGLKTLSRSPLTIERIAFLIQNFKSYE